MSCVASVSGISVEAEAPHGRGQKPRSAYNSQIKPIAKPQRLSAPTFSTASVKYGPRGHVRRTSVHPLISGRIRCNAKHFRVVPILTIPDSPYPTKPKA